MQIESVFLLMACHICLFSFQSICQAQLSFDESFTTTITQETKPSNQILLFTEYRDFTNGRQLTVSKRPQDSFASAVLNNIEAQCKWTYQILGSSNLNCVAEILIITAFPERFFFLPIAKFVSTDANGIETWVASLSNSVSVTITVASTNKNIPLSLVIFQSPTTIYQNVTSWIPGAPSESIFSTPNGCPPCTNVPSSSIKLTSFIFSILSCLLVILSVKVA